MNNETEYNGNDDSAIEEAEAELIQEEAEEVEESASDIPFSIEPDEMPAPEAVAKAVAMLQDIVDQTPEYKPRQARALSVIKQTETAVTIGGMGVIFDGVDLEGDTFTKQTDFHIGMVPAPPVYYDHTLTGIKHQFGKVVKIEAMDEGLWIEAELERHADYMDAVLKLIEAGALGWSSGSVAHLVERENNVIKNWPLAEFSMTPTPAEPRVLPLSIVKQLQSLEGLLPKAPENGAAQTEAEAKSEETVITEKEKEIMNEETNEDALKARIDALEAQVKATPVNGVGAVKASSQSSLERSRKAWNDYAVNGTKVVTTSPDSAGGYVIDEIFVADIVKPLTEGSLASQLGLSIRNIARGKPMHVRKRDVAPKAIPTAECDPFADKQPTYSDSLVNPFKYTCATDASVEWLSCAIPDAISDLNNYALESFTNAQNGSIVNGDGVTEGEGLLTCVPVRATAASATAITFTDLKKLYFSIGHQYRAMDNTAWLMSDATFQAVSCLVDGENRPLLTGDYSEAFSMRLFGRPIVINNEMPDIAATNKVVVFGDFGQFEIGVWEDVEFLRDPYTLAKQGKVSFTYWSMWSHVCLDTNALGVLDMAP